MLDRLAAEASAADTAEGWARYYHALAAAPLIVPLEAAADETVRLAEIATGDGPTVLAFDRMERMVAHLAAPGDYAEMPGAELARALAGSGISLTVNLGTAGSETVLDPDRLAWLAANFGAEVARDTAAGVTLAAPADPPPDLIATLGETVGALGRDCPEAWLVTMTDGDGGEELVLVLGLAGAAAGMEAEIAETLTRAGQALTDRRFAVACPDRGSRLMDAARRAGIGIGDGLA